MKKFLFLGAILLLTSIKMHAQQVLPDVKTENAVGIEHVQPRATLDVNGNTRIRSIEDCVDCNWVLVTGSNKIVQKLQIYSSNKEGSFERRFTRNNCPQGKIPENYSVRKNMTASAMSIHNQNDADIRAQIKARRKAQVWVYEHGQEIANRDGACADGYKATRTGSYQRSFSKDNCSSGYEGEPYLVKYTATASYESSISPEDANQQAEAEAIQIAKDWINENGQNEANKKGRCRKIVYTCEESASASVECFHLNYSPETPYEAIETSSGYATAWGWSEVSYESACSDARSNAYEAAKGDAYANCSNSGGNPY